MKHFKKAAALLLALTVSLALVACGGDDETTSTGTESTARTSADKGEGGAPESPATPTIVIRNGEPVEGVEELEYDSGDQIRFTVRSDVADEIHVHGYDLMKDVPAGGSVTFSFPADLEGIFEVELEGRKVQIAELTVNP